MYNNGAHITIGSLPPLEAVAKVHIKSTWMEMTDKCTITFPRNVKMGNTPIKSLIKLGDKVSVGTFYNGDHYVEFVGYVRYVKPTTPLQIECEDEMYQLKKGSYTKSWSSATLDDILQYIYPHSKPWKKDQGGKQYKTFGKVVVGAFTVSNCTPAKVLQEIEKVLGLKSFFRTMPGDFDPTLIVGVPYDSDSQEIHTYHFNKNVQPGHSLEYHTKDDLKIGVKATSQMPNGKKIEVTLGDKDGEQHTLHYYNLPKETLTNRAKADYKKLQYDGYRGSLTGWGYPRVNHGDIVNLQGSSEGLSADQVGSDWTTSGILVTATTYLTDGTNISVQVGDQNHTQQVDLNFYQSSGEDVPLTTQALTTAANKELMDRTAAAYYIDEINIDFDMSGYKRECKLGPPARGMTDFEGNETYNP
jgi:hypothetical protein